MEGQAGGAVGVIALARLARLGREDVGQVVRLLRVADQLDIGVESLRSWVKQAEIDGGWRAGTTTADAGRIKELEQEVKELRRANAILKSASAFFAAEFDRPQK